MPSATWRKPARSWPRSAEFLLDKNSRAYIHAIKRTCKKSGVPPWHPHQLHHNAATQLRKEFGLDVARAVLGHSDADTTTIYAERDAALAADAMERLG